MVNEGIASTMTGLKGIPNIAEIIQLQRDIELLSYTGGTIHFTGISTAEGVEIIRKAKKKGLSITADVHVAHLIFTEAEVLNFDTNFKLLPPLRTENDRKALWEGLKDGSIDCIVSAHRAQSKEEKDLEFDLASFGNISLETLFSALSSAKEFDLDLIIDKLTAGPRKIFEIQIDGLKVGDKADLTLFSPNLKWKYHQSIGQSKSQNSPFLNQELTGKSIGIIHKGQLVLAQEMV
jgi:dihydroorotase